MIIRLLIFILFPLGLFGCHLIKRPISLIPINQQAVIPEEESTSSLLKAQGEFIYDNSPEIQMALKEFVSSGKAPIVKRAGFVQFPFGEVQPILNCRPNYGCDIELQAGEEVKAVILGNEPLWDYLIWESNQEQNPVPHVTIGPRISSARTNAIIGTNRRTYHLELLSTTRSEYTRSAKFYYPRERLHEFQQKAQRKSRLASARARRKERNKLLKDIAASGGLPYEFVSFGWNISASKSVSWKPVRVFDDSAHIYIQFPEHVVFEDFPGVYVPTDKDKLTKPVWRTVKPNSNKSREKGFYIMVDGMYDELRLVGGFGKKQQTVVITREK